MTSPRHTEGATEAVYALVYRDGTRFGSETYTDLGKAQRAWAYTNCSYSDLNAPLLINLTTQMVMLPDGSERPFLPTPPAPNQGDES